MKERTIKRNAVIDLNKFNDIYLQLEAAILEKKYLPGELLPSENELSKQFQASRETIRKALALLLENGYIQKQQGKGSIVLDVNRFVFPVAGLTSFKELQESQKMPSQTIVTKNQTGPISKPLMERLHLPKETQVISLERVRKIQGEAVILDYDFLLADVISDIPNEVAEDSIYDYIENDLGLTISYAQKEITVEPVTKQDKELLDLNGDSHVVVVRSDVYMQDTTLFQYTESRHRMDKFRFVEFARRKQV